MKLTVKIIQGVECCVEITEEETVVDLKTAVERELQIPVANQRLILKGKTLQDSSIIKEIKVKDGDKVHLSVRKTAVTVDDVTSETKVSEPTKVSQPNPKQVLETELRSVLRNHFRSEEELTRIVNAVLRSLHNKFCNLSLDDIEKICSRWNKDNILEF
eukprot:TRINITY_DN50009_c0_g1_i1.p1 TRINITY_DN50009_c0_g1~~TRINITY_DN50009_c0_g1_i1.p1  ORF type:complete len:159 (+),score=33.96 TRINITY_DN50009_c0_g1_i1:46-522(+)